MAFERRNNKKVELGAVSESIRSAEEINRRDFLKATLSIAGALLLRRPEQAAAFVKNYLNRPGEASEKKGEKAPVISVEFFLSSHMTEADKRGLAEKIKEADVFVPETPGWTRKERERYEAVSRGEMTVADVARHYGIREDSSYEGDAAFFETLRAIYGSQKHIEFLDMPAEDPLIQKLFETDDKLRDLDFGRDFPLIAKEYRELLKEYAELQLKREAYILRGLEALRSKIARGGLPLCNKNEVRILLSYGAVHTGLFHRIHETKMHPTVSFPSTPYIFSYGSEIIRRFMFKKGVPDDLVTRGVVEKIAISSLWNQLPGFESQKKTTFIRKALDRFSIEELGRLFDDAKGIYFESSRTAELFKRAVAEKGIKWPMLRQELDAVISEVGKTGVLRKKKRK